MAMASRSEDARFRLKEEMKRQRLVQRDLAGLVNWSQSKVAKVLGGHVVLSVEDLCTLCFALNISVVEVLRDKGMEFCADMTPTELRIHERIRGLPSDMQMAVMKVLHITEAEPRRALPKPQKRKMA